MGARLALEALLTYKAPFLSLTCLSTTIEVENPKKRKEQESVWLQTLQQSSIPTFIDSWYSSPLFDGFNIPKRRYNQNKENLIKILEEYSILKAPSFKKNILQSDMPISFIYRKNDPKSSPVQDHKRLYFVEAKNHAIHLEVPDQITRLLKKNLTFNNKHEMV